MTKGLIAWKEKSLLSHVVCKLAWGSIVYNIWRQKFSYQICTEEQILHQINWEVCTRVVGKCNGRFKVSYINEKICLNWGIPSNILLYWLVGVLCWFLGDLVVQFLLRSCWLAVWFNLRVYAPLFFFYSFVQFLLMCRYDSFSWMVFVVFLWLSQKIGLCVWLLFCFSYSVTLFQYWVLLAGERILFQLCGMKKYIHPKKILTCACLLTCEKHILFNRIFSNSFDVNKKTYILHIFKKYMTILYTYTVFGEISSNPIERKPLPIS